MVWGFIGLKITSVYMKELGADAGVSLLNGAIILALMSMPIIVSISEDALNAVPDSYREAAIGLGVTKWQMVYRDIPFAILSPPSQWLLRDKNQAPHLMRPH